MSELGFELGFQHTYGLNPASAPSLASEPERVSLEQPVIGFRSWGLINGHLHGGNGMPWHAPVTQALCTCFTPNLAIELNSTVQLQEAQIRAAQMANGHYAPVHHCTCGLYAFHDFLPDHHTWGWAGGIQAWGKIEAHQEGFRCEFARIIAVVQRGNTEMESLAKRYGAHLVSADELVSVAKEYGEPIPKDMRFGAINDRV